MSVIAAVLVVLVAVLHAWFLVLEMFLWTRPAGLKTFRNTPEKAETTRVLAATRACTTASLPPACCGGW